MLDLVAEAPGCQPPVLHLEPFAVPILCADAHHLRAGDNAVLAGHAQAALQPRLLALRADDLRVHQLDELVVLVQHHAHPAQDTHLRRSQPHTAGLSQRIRHIVQQRVQTTVKIRYGAAHPGQALLALQCDLS